MKARLVLFSLPVAAVLAALLLGPDRIEVRLDGPDGRLLGTLGPLAPAPGKEHFLTVQSDLEPADGMHDVYFVFRTPEGDGVVGEVDWFFFQRASE